MSTASRSTRATATGYTRAVKSGDRNNRGGAPAGANAYNISNVSWATLEPKFNELMDLLNSPTSGINALEARAQHREKVNGVITALLDKAQDECRSLLIQGNGEAAAEAGVKVLKLREKFYGAKALQLVPAYLHLARANQFMERYGDAEDMLSLANYVVQKNQSNEELTNATKAELHQTYGLLYAADEKLEVAVKHLTCATYYMSCIHGPQHVLTTFSYFDLGNVFAAKASMESAMAMYDNVKEIWYEYLANVLEDVVVMRNEAERLKRYTDEGDELYKNGYPSTLAFGSDNLVDASKMLHGIYAIQKERYRMDHPSTARAQFVLGLFLLWVYDEEEAVEHLTAARASSQKFYGPRHPVVSEIEDWCTRFGYSFPDPEEEEVGNGDASHSDAGDASPKFHEKSITHPDVAQQ